MIGRAKGRAGLMILLGIVVVSIGLRLLLGRTVDAGGDITATWGLPVGIVLEIRGTSVLAACIAGAALGLSGLAFQNLLRNPLASPWVLGVSSGAGFGVMVGAWLGTIPGAAWLASILLFGAGLPGAAAGAIAAIGVVWWLSRRLGGFDPVSLVLCGVVVNSTFAAGTMLLQHLSPNGVRGDFTTWMMGRIPELLPAWLSIVSVFAVLVVAGLAWRWHAVLDAAGLDDDEARSVGVPLLGLRRGLLLVGGGLATVAVVVVGPIAFVGLLAPHAARLLVGAAHRLLVPGAALAGAGVLVVADLVRQIVDLGGGRMPVGILTALVGGPVFLWLLIRRRGVL